MSPTRGNISFLLDPFDIAPKAPSLLKHALLKASNGLVLSSFHSLLYLWVTSETAALPFLASPRCGYHDTLLGLKALVHLLFLHGLWTTNVLKRWTYAINLINENTIFEPKNTKFIFKIPFFSLTDLYSKTAIISWISSVRFLWKLVFLIFFLHNNLSFFWTGKASNVYYLPSAARFADPWVSISNRFFFSFQTYSLHCLHSQGQEASSGRIVRGLVQGQSSSSAGDAGYGVASRQRSPPWPPREAQALFSWVSTELCSDLSPPATGPCASGVQGALAFSASPASHREMHPKYVLTEWAGNPWATVLSCLIQKLSDLPKGVCFLQIEAALKNHFRRLLNVTSQA